MKYYAVKKGRQTGIYENWEDCKQQIDKYSGAVFKSFEDKTAAEEFLINDLEEPINEELPAAYIDGSFSKKNNCYSWGGFMGGQIFQGTGNNPTYLSERNVAGELIGTLQILFYCFKNSIPEINLFYDYAGIEAYATGAWKAQTALAVYYKDTFNICDIKVHFQKVKGHTGIEGNELADCLAKEAAGVTLRKKDITALQTFKEKGACLWK